MHKIILVEGGAQMKIAREVRFFGHILAVLGIRHRFDNLLCPEVILF